MKRLLLSILALGSALVGQAQVQRMVLVEEFTNASCPPCASQNPSFNALLGQNTSKVIPLKYQTVWPGVDPMNAQNPTDVATRVTYYSVTGVPWAVMDGDTNKMPTTAQAYGGAPAGLTQAQIDAEYALSSPITMNLSHNFNAATDSVIINLTITASQALAGNLKIMLSLTESLIKFATPPGTNGELEFENVMRKMIPDANGITLPNMAVGQSQNFSWTVPVPAYIYMKTQLGVVAFVQDISSKVVHQAAFSKPPYATDITIAGIQNVSCANTVNATVDIENQGTVTLNNFIVNYSVDGAANQTQNWNGTLAPGATANVGLPAITGLTNGSHYISCYLSAPNAIVALSNQGNPAKKYFATFPTAGAAPITQDFASATFPPAGYATVAATGADIWARSTSSQSGGAGSAEAKFYDIQDGIMDLYLPKTNLNLAGQTAVSIDFYEAYTYFASGATVYYDTLQIMTSTNCGNSWQPIWENSGVSLATAAADANPFTPASNQWRGYSISLNSVLGQPDVLVKFVGKSGYGNNLYLDNINLRYGVVNKVDEFTDANALIISPNPASDRISVSYSLVANDAVTLSLIDVFGKTVYTKKFDSAEKINDMISVSELANGIYNLTLKSNAGKTSKKVVVTH